MRQDMYKVIVERPRRRSKGKLKTRPHSRQLETLADEDVSNLALDDKRQKVKGRIANLYDAKELNENLNPLERFLRKNIGRPWDKVFSEVCEHIDLDNTVKRHVREHVDRFVEIHVDLIDGHPHYKTNGFMRSSTPLRSGDMWVHPETGLLCVVKKNSPRIKKPKESKDMEKLALEYFAFVGVKVTSDYRGLLHKEPGPGGFGSEWAPLAPKHARYDMNHGKYNKAWLQIPAHQCLRNFHSYFKELFKTLPKGDK
jgi:hypothetical protein